MFYRGRYFDSVLKRFISQHRIGLARGMNVYAYVNGRPVSLSDPSGLIYRDGNEYSDIRPPGLGCQRAVWGPGGYIYGWKSCGTPKRPPPDCKRPDHIPPWNPHENPMPKPMPMPPAPPRGALDAPYPMPPGAQGRYKSCVSQAFAKVIATGHSGGQPSLPGICTDGHNRVDHKRLGINPR